MKPLMFLCQLLIVPPLVVLAAALTQQFAIVPTRNPALSNDQLAHLIVVFSLCHGALYVVSWRLGKGLESASPFHLLRESCFATIASALGGCYYLLLTTVPFNASLLAYIYLLVPFGLTILVSLAALFLRQRGWRPAQVLAALRHLLTRGLAYLAVLLALLPGVLAHLLPASGDLQRAVESLRVAYNIEVASAWTLDDPVPGLLFDQAMDVDFLDEHEFYVLERKGRIKRVAFSNGWEASTILDFSEVSTLFENGALALALHPEYGKESSPNRGFVFVYFTAYEGDKQQNRLSRFDLSRQDDVARRGSETILIEHDISRPGVHNGGTLLFDAGGYLYLSLGDNKQLDLQNANDNFLGAIVRIDVDQRGGELSRPITQRSAAVRTGHYFIPRDNPFVDDDRVLDEYWALGLRNPFRMAIDDVTGAVWVGDVGEERYEEIDRLVKGANAQWPYREGPGPGRMPKPDIPIGIETPPFYAYELTALDRAVIGGPLYRGQKFPELWGKYIFADNQSGLIRVLDPNQDPPEARILAKVPFHAQQGITSLKVSPGGELFVTVLGDREGTGSQLFRLRRAEDGPPLEPLRPAVESAAIESASPYHRLCARCHGDDGRSLPLRNQPDFTDPNWQARTADEHIREVILRGGAALGLNEEMPAWAGIVADQDLDLLVKRIRSFARSAVDDDRSK